MRKTLNLSDVLYTVFDELDFFYRSFSHDSSDSAISYLGSLRHLLFFYSAYAFKSAPDHLLDLIDDYCAKVSARVYPDLFDLTSAYLNDLQMLGKGVK